MRPPKNRFFGSSFRILSGPPLPIPRQTSTPICQREFAPFPFLLILSGASNILFFLDDCAGKPRSSKRQKCHRKGDPRPVFIEVVWCPPLLSPLNVPSLFARKGQVITAGYFLGPERGTNFTDFHFPFSRIKWKILKWLKVLPKRNLTGIYNPGEMLTTMWSLKEPLCLTGETGNSAPDSPS